MDYITQSIYEPFIYEKYLEGHHYQSIAEILVLKVYFTKVVVTY